ncbi:hypothetical protein WJX81_004355, partial [Elliptochloris bilobata]
RSFVQAAQAGASFVEFDVQVTADGVPVIWHDDYVVTRGRCGRDDDLPTLAEVFKGVPESVGFDIEVKMTTPDNLPAAPAAEVERMVSAILATVDRVAAYSSRTIVFTSFDPDVCRVLRARQARCPVMFLSGGGAYAHVDARRTSVPGAVAWALEAGLQGLVLEAGSVQAQPEAVAAARRKGLMVLTYGLQNNDPAWVRRQAHLGVHAVIVDDVERIAAALHLTPVPAAA